MLRLRYFSKRETEEAIRLAIKLRTEKEQAEAWRSLSRCRRAMAGHA